LAALGPDRALAAYEDRKAGLDDLAPPPPADVRARERGAAFTGMPARLYREALRAGRGDAYLDGLSELVRLYNGELPFPGSWTDDREDRAVLGEKAEVLVFLLSAALRKDLWGAFAGWRWPVSARLRAAIGALRSSGWNDAVKRSLLESFLRGHILGFEALGGVPRDELRTKLPQIINGSKEDAEAQPSTASVTPPTSSV
jgi:hypothetical protein